MNVSLLQRSLTLGIAVAAKKSFKSKKKMSLVRLLASARVKRSPT